LRLAAALVISASTSTPQARRTMRARRLPDPNW